MKDFLLELSKGILIILIIIGVVYLGTMGKEKEQGQMLDKMSFTANCEIIAHPHKFYVEEVYGQHICIVVKELVE